MNKNTNLNNTSNNPGADNSASPEHREFNERLHGIHKIFVQMLNPKLATFFEGLNDFFFDQAEQAKNNDLQTQYFAAIGDIRKNQTNLIRQFVKNVNVIFQKFKTRDFVYFVEQDAVAETERTALTLVKEDDLDQKLAINNVAVKITQTYHEELYLINERLAYMLGDDEEVDDHINPIGPDAIINAFALSLSVMRSENNIKLMIIKLFEKNMMESLGPAYRKINAYLKKQGVLPEIKFEVKKPQAAGQAINNSINYLTHALSEEDENYKKIAHILQHDREQEPQQNYSAESIVQFSQLSDALNQIKAELFTDKELETQQAISPLELKDELIRKLKSLKALTGKEQINQADENTIDLVGQMFQFLVEDRDVPESIQLVLSKLQLPYLQIALKDPTFFSDKHNNARQLLNIMAQCAIGWSPEVDEQSVFLNKVKEVVNFILKNHEKNINYEKLIQRFIQFDQQLKKKSHIQERRTYEKISGRERLQHAKQQTALFLRQELQGQKLPSLVREVLLKPWANVLILAELRQKDSPEELQKNQQFVNRLIKAANPNTKKKLSSSAIGKLCAEMTEGLKAVAYEPSELKAKWDEMKTCLEKINGTQAKLSADDYINPADILKLSKEFNRESSVGELLEMQDQQDGRPDTRQVIEDKYSKRVEAFQLGEWLEVNSKKKPQRVKLSWISPISGKLLFVNAKGAKVVDLYPHDLADMLRKGESRVLQQIPIFDRAMSSIAEKMKQKTPASD